MSKFFTTTGLLLYFYLFYKKKKKNLASRDLEPWMLTKILHIIHTASADKIHNISQHITRQQHKHINGDSEFFLWETDHSTAEVKLLLPIILTKLTNFIIN